MNPSDTLTKFNDEHYRTALEQSFFKNIQDNITNDINFEPVENFTLEDDDVASLHKGEINDLHFKRDSTIGNLLSTKSTCMGETPNYCGLKQQGSNSHFFYSGYFGEKKENGEEEKGSNMNYQYQPNPFAAIEEERMEPQTVRNGHSIKFWKQSMNTQEENANSSFLSNTSHLFKSNHPQNSFMKFCNNSNSFNDMVKSVNLSSMSSSSNKIKKKILSTEELLIEKIKKEKEEVNRLKMKNQQNLGKVKSFVSRPITPQPLTLLKPFNLSMNQSKMLMKKRVTNTNVDEINSKITEAIKKKCEKVGENGKETMFAYDKIILQKTPTNIRHMKRSLGLSKSKSKSPSKYDDDVQTLSSRIEKYCVISGYEKKREPTKSPLKLCFGSVQQNEDKFLNNNINNIAQNPIRTHKTTSIRKHFATSNTLTSEDRVVKEMQNFKFTPRPLNKNIFKNKKQNDIETFEMVLQKTREEKQIVEKNHKDNFRQERVKSMKMRNINKENFNTQNKKNEMVLEL